MGAGKITVPPQTFETSDVVIETIAKTILVNANFERDPGLFSGKMGAALFLYYYDRYKNNPIYLELADELVLEIIEDLNKHDTFYLNGLAGIGWGVKHLMKNDFIEEASDVNIFTMLNRSIINKGIPGGRSMEAYGIASYFLSIFPDTVIDSIDDEIDRSIMIEKIIFIIDEIKQFHDDLSKFLVSEDVFLKALNDRKLNFCALIGLYNQAAITLMKASRCKLYASVVNELMGSMHGNQGQIARFMQEIIKNRMAAIRIKDNSFFLAFLETLNAYIQITDYLGEPIEMFSGTPGNIKKYVSAMETLDNTTALTRVSINACLSRIGSSLGHAFVDRIRDLEFSGFRELLQNNSRFTMAFAFEGNRLNIGVGGLAGLGLSLLSESNPGMLGWDEAILIS